MMTSSTTYTPPNGQNLSYNADLRVQQIKDLTMTTQIQPLDETWLDITAALSLVSSTQYLLQNAGPVTVFIQESPGPPIASDVGRRLLANTSLPIFVSTDNFYARTEKLGSQLIVDLGF